MPTGCTAAVADGEVTTLREFTLKCARAFIGQRDDPPDAEIPKVQTPDVARHLEALDAARTRLHWLRSLPAVRVIAEATAALDAADAARAARRAKTRATQERYVAMLAQVATWKTSPQLEPLRAFMLQQLCESMRYDCEEPNEPDPTRPGSATWYVEETRQAEWTINYHEKSIAEAYERAEAGTAWLTALWASLEDVK